MSGGRGWGSRFRGPPSLDTGAALADLSGDALALPEKSVSIPTVSVDQSTDDTITFTRGDPVVLDEIRFAATYDEVIGIAAPPAGTLLLVK